MATRALIARGDGIGWEAVYHHWDGYPSGLGETLYHLYNGHFGKDAEAMLKCLIDDHPSGWSTINGADFDLEPGFSNYGEDRPNRPQCYCHGDRSEPPPEEKITHKDANCAGAEYCYVINPASKTMKVLERVYQDGSTAVQFFGVDASEVASGVRWREIGHVPLDGPEPDWGKM